MNTYSSSQFSLGSNLLLRTDSYKASHWLQYPPNTTAVYSYIEARGGVFPATVFFGLQAYLREYLSRPITRVDVDEATAIFAAHGEPFNRDGWLKLVDKHAGWLPVRIRAVAEGSIIPTRNVLLTIENTDPEFYWLTSYLETELLRAIWYPSTVATLSASAKATITRYLEASSDDPSQIAFKLHDFGARGVSSLESASLGGLAHLVNFMGTDTVSALVAARRYYDCDMAGFSIPAAEHSTITGWGREHEADAYRNMLKQFAKVGSILAVVSDSYDIYHACEAIWGGELKQAVIDSGATVVIRPDSGKPEEVVLKVAQILSQRFGYTLNARGYKVINHVRIIQGDGINLTSLKLCLSNLYHNGFAADNIAFGMGGGLLQQVNRDTQQFAMKCSSMQVDGAWREVYKDPIGDKAKSSKRGQLALLSTLEHGVSGFKTVQKMPNTETNHVEVAGDLLVPVYENGKILQSFTLEQVRHRAQASLGILTSTLPL